jgi:hypothetical protein
MTLDTIYEMCEYVISRYDDIYKKIRACFILFFKFHYTVEHHFTLSNLDAYENMYDWLVLNIGYSNVYYTELVERKFINNHLVDLDKTSRFHFKNKKHALLFKTVWGGIMPKNRYNFTKEVSNV